MARTYEEMLIYEVNRLRGDRNSQNMFFGKAIAIQNSPKTFKADYADKKFEFACDVLMHCDYCNHSMCAQCKLNTAHENAKEEILGGLRSPSFSVKKVVINLDHSEDYIFKKHTDKYGNVTLTLRKK